MVSGVRRGLCLLRYTKGVSWVLKPAGNNTSTVAVCLSATSCVLVAHNLK
ncbi:hypothetical protein ACRRTK_012018 [Alexandromys fortis]